MKTKFILSFIMGFTMVLFTQAQTIEIVGMGVHDTQVNTLMFSDIATIDHVVVEAIFKLDSPPNGQANFYDGDENYLVDATPVEVVLNATPYTVYTNYFTATFSSVGPEGITLDQLSNFGGMHSFIAYVYRNLPDPEFTSYADFNHVFMFKNGIGNPYNYVFPIDPANGPRDINVKAVISELAFDNRVCVINVTAGAQTVQQILQLPNLGNSLNITPFTIYDVPGSVTQITVSIYSPPYGVSPTGDSFISGGIVLDVEELEDPEYYCTLTQGFYGNYGGKFNGMTTVALLNDLLEDDLVVGRNSNTLTLTQLDVDCVIARLPGGGQPKALNGAATCGNPVGIQLHNDGRYKNILLAQTITMGLNLRLDDNLGSLEIDDLTFLPLAIRDFFGAGATITDLYELANDLLGGIAVSGLSKGDAADALGKINDNFDECAYFTPPPPPPPSSFRLKDSDPINSELEKTMNIFPNPIADYATIEFTAQSDNNTTVEVYNMMGSKIGTIFKGYVTEGESYSTGFDASDLPGGVYFVVLRNGEYMTREKISIK